MCTVETEMNSALHEAFHAALLTGSCERAAQAVEASLGTISPDFSREALLEETETRDLGDEARHARLAACSPYGCTCFVQGA